MNFGFDIDDTITCAPEIFKVIIDALMAAGHEVHIITDRDPKYNFPGTEQQLKDFDIKYTKLHLSRHKDVVCDQHNIDLAFDDGGEIYYKGRYKFWTSMILPKKSGGDFGLNYPFINFSKPDTDIDTGEE